MHRRYGLVLMVTHACNLRCDYCYVGRKFPSVMPAEVGLRAIDRAVASLEQGGTLELGFFGGEPLLEPDLIEQFLDHAAARLAGGRGTLAAGLTTNGSISTSRAWRLMMRDDLALAVSHDGLPQVHDAHRPFADGQGSSESVLKTVRALADSGKAFRIVMVVRPDNVESLPAGIEFLIRLGVRRFDPSLDLWTRWTAADLQRLDAAVARCADLWRDRLPDVALSWLDEKAARLMRVPMSLTARCGFGCGEIAVAPSGWLYPCERVIGEDLPDNPLRLSGHALEGPGFLEYRPYPCRAADACRECEIALLCDTTCRCSNFIRTGDVRRPDGLLCRLNRACVRETARTLGAMIPSAAEASRQEGCHGRA
jgi:uncharacterized protein